jgi:hypothetical protein
MGKLDGKSTYYVDRFLSKNLVAADIMLLKLFPDSKEITESMGAMLGLFNSGINPSDKDVVVFCIGDGHVPRTGGLLAFKTAWTIISIDPCMRVEKEEFKKIKRLYMIKNHIEHVNIDYEIKNGNIPDISQFKTQIIVHVHSHAYLTNSISRCFKTDEENKDKIRLALSIPCCIPDNLAKTCKSYLDRFIFSEKNRVNIYPIQNIKLEV